MRTIEVKIGSRRATKGEKKKSKEDKDKSMVEVVEKALHHVNNLGADRFT